MLKVTMMQLSEDTRVSLTKLSGVTAISGEKKSLNTLILEAVEKYLDLPLNQQEVIALKTPWKAFTVRMTDATKKELLKVCGHLQVQTGVPVSLSSVINTAIHLYLQQHSIKV